MKKLYSVALAVALLCLASPAIAGTYGPEDTKPFTWPERFTVEANETVEQAKDKVRANRRCARAWAIGGTIVGTTADILTTQSNQRAGYRESNPIYGKHATVGEMLVVHAISGAFTIWRIEKQAKNHPAAACRTAKITAGVALLPGVINLGVRLVM